ncbi:hypothetical protein MPRG_05010 [Mycobacterium paragordonae]|uniref:Uncharacterized protein n=1 Tax=Mycobacterium paragordonae TaxID=1389713 RepID=A0ABQ1BYT2_9MYCO|nr:hypothetical protein MPRG_05010 [Mycobacterium paragordonae]
MVPNSATRRVNTLPKRRWQAATAAGPRPIISAASTQLGNRGPGGSFAEFVGSIIRSSTPAADGSTAWALPVIWLAF